jgi:LAO/AO transport system kinase
MMLVDDLLAGSRRALARVLTLIENDAAAAAEALAALFPHTGRAHLVGVTGAPGTGKSTLVNQVALELRRQGRTVGIVAVDPTSPFSGGAILGDRIRMRDLAGDPGVFIRSMASRGSLGGLARATSNVVRALDAAGFDVVLIETVGAGQSEVDIARHAQTVVVVEAPGLGDDIQAFKAGILEIADVLVVNKADDPRAKNTARALQAMLDLGNGSAGRHMALHHGVLMAAALPTQATAEPDSAPRWAVPIQETNALRGDGVPDLVAALDSHRAYLAGSGEMARRERSRAALELDSLLRERLLARLLADVDRQRLAALVDDIVSRRTVPHEAARLLVEESAP